MTFINEVGHFFAVAAFRLTVYEVVFVFCGAVSGVVHHGCAGAPLVTRATPEGTTSEYS